MFRDLLGFLIVFLITLFAIDNLRECYKASKYYTFKYLLPILGFLAIYYISTHLPSMESHSIITLLMYQSAINCLVLKLLLTSMSGYRFNIVNIEHFILLLPVIAYNILQVSAATEILITQICCFVLFWKMPVTIGILSHQYVHTEKISFFTLK